MVVGVNALEKQQPLANCLSFRESGKKVIIGGQILFARSHRPT
jgi:hypothetical protein